MRSSLTWRTSCSSIRSTTSTRRIGMAVAPCFVRRLAATENVRRRYARQALAAAGAVVRGARTLRARSRSACPPAESPARRSWSGLAPALEPSGDGRAAATVDIVALGRRAAPRRRGTRPRPAWAAAHDEPTACRCSIRPDTAAAARRRPRARVPGRDAEALRSAARLRRRCGRCCAGCCPGATGRTPSTAPSSSGRCWRGAVRGPVPGVRASRSTAIAAARGRARATSAIDYGAVRQLGAPAELFARRRARSASSTRRTAPASARALCRLARGTPGSGRTGSSCRERAHPLRLSSCPSCCPDRG